MKNFYKLVFAPLFSFVFCMISFQSAAAPLWEFRAETPDADLAWLYAKSRIHASEILYHSPAVIMDASTSLGYSPFFKKTFEFSDNFSFRFLFAFDSLEPAFTPPVAQDSAVATALNFFRLSGANYSERTALIQIVSLGLLLKQETWYLRPQNLPLEPRKPYYLEAQVSRLKGRLICAKVLLNNALISLDTLASDSGALRTAELILGNYTVRYPYRGWLHFDNLALGVGPLGNVPPAPKIGREQQLRSRYDPGRITFFRPDYEDPLGISSWGGSQFRIQSQDQSWELPLLDTGLDTLNRDSMVIAPIDLKPGPVYLWRVRHRDRLGNWSDWSDPVELKYDSAAIVRHLSTKPSVQSLGFALPGKRKWLVKVPKETWLDLVFVLKVPDAFQKLGYCVAWANNKQYTEGSITNRGGKYFSGGSYVFNLSRAPDKAFEKNEENSYKTSPVLNNRGLYIDPSEGQLVFDPDNSSARLRVIFPQAAETGDWSLRGFSADTIDGHSALYFSSFELIEKKAFRAGRAGWKWVALAAGLAVLFLMARAFRLRKSRTLPDKPGPDQELFNRFSEYVLGHLNRELRVLDMERHLSASRGSIYRSVKSCTGQSLKGFVLHQKIEKAKQLMVSTPKDISEIMMEVGFIDPSHFSKIFKKYTGESPLQYKMKRSS